MPAQDFGCNTARDRWFRVNGLTLHALEWGETGRPGVCFLHGGAAHAHWFDRVVPSFVDRYHLISLDQRGHGQSAWADPPSYGTEDFASDLGGVFDQLGWDQVTLVGHSMGGANSIAFSAWNPDRVRALVIVDSRPAIPQERLGAMQDRGRRPLKRHPSIEAAVERFRLLPRETNATPEFMAHLARTGVVERDGGFIFRFDPMTYAERRPVDGWTLVDRIRARTLIVRGALSPILTAEMGARLHKAIPDSTLVEIPAAYHHLTLDQPEHFVAALDRFLKTL